MSATITYRRKSVIDRYVLAILQHSLIQVGAQVVYLQRDTPFRHSWSGVETKERLRAILKI